MRTRATLRMISGSSLTRAFRLLSSNICPSESSERVWTALGTAGLKLPVVRDGNRLRISRVAWRRARRLMPSVGSV